MTVVEQIIRRLLYEKGTGIFVKHLRNGPLYTCKCPACGTLHGGFRNYAEAQVNLKCRHCYRNEVEKLKREVQKVEEPPKPQKDLFRNPLQKRAVIGEADEMDFDVKDVGYPDAEHVAYEIYDGSERYPVTTEAKIGRWNYKYPGEFSGQWLLMGMKFNRADKRFTPWREIRARLENGEALDGHIIDFDHGSYRQWGHKAKVYKTNMIESLGDSDEIEDVKSILGDIPLDPGAPTEPGQVNKQVCENAYYGQNFFSRHDFYRDGSPHQVRVSGKCKTWKTRPHEFRLPVKYGFYQSFYITQANADEWSTLALDRHGNPV